MTGGLAKLALTSGALLVPAAGWAQAIGAGNSIVVEPDLDRTDVAGARAEPEYQPSPTLIGPFFIQPSLSVVAEYMSNVFNRPDAKASALVVITPSLSLKANLPRHDLQFAATGNVRRFERYSTENSEEFSLNGQGRFDLGSRDAITGAAEFSRRIEPRSSTGSVPNAAEPVSYQRAIAEMGGVFSLGDLRLEPGVRFQRLQYDPVTVIGGGQVDQSFRDMRSLRGDMRISYDLSGLVAAFVAGSYEDINSLSAPAALDRASHTYSLTAGLKGEISPVVSGEIGVGYQSRDYAQPNYRDFKGLTYRADLQWYVTPLVTLRAQASRSFRNSGIREVGGILTDAFVVSAYYDPLRNLRVALSASAERGDYGEVGTRTWTKSTRLQAQYRFNPMISAGGFAELLRQDVNGLPVVNQFSSAAVGIGVTITP